AIMEKTARSPAKGKMDKARYGAGIIDAQAAVIETGKKQLRERNQQGSFQLLLGLLVAGGIATGLRRRGALGSKLGGGYLAGVLIGASGLFFLPSLLGDPRPGFLVDLAASGLPAWGPAN